MFLKKKLKELVTMKKKDFIIGIKFIWLQHKEDLVLVQRLLIGFKLKDQHG